MDFEFKIGTPIFSRDGEIGRLKYLVIDPKDETITNLIVERGRLLHKDVVVPVHWVEKASEDGIVLNASTAELEGLPEFREAEFRAPDPTLRPVAGHPPSETLIWIDPYHGFAPIGVQAERPWVLYRGKLGVTDDEVVVRRGQPVTTGDGQRVATLDHVLADDNTNRILHLVAHRGQWLQRGEDLIVPADAVSSIADQEIRLRLSREELERLDRYQAPMNDAQLEEAITRGLQTQPETKGQHINVQVDRGLVRLFGEVSEAVASAVASIAGRMQGVIGVEDHTTRPATAAAHASATDAGDAAIAARVAEALQRQRQEDLSAVRVHVDNGVAHLTGTTPSIAGKALAEQIAGSVPNVRSVTNDVQTDTAVRARVEAALAEDRRTALAPIEVIVRAGVVTLSGEVHSPQVKDAAEQIARSAVGVKAVISELEVCPVRDSPIDFMPAQIQMPS